MCLQREQVTDKESFEHVETWMREIKKFTSDSEVRIIVVGNKVDLAASRQVHLSPGARLLPEDQWPLVHPHYCDSTVRKVTKAAAHSYCEDKQLPYVEASAKSSTGVEEVNHEHTITKFHADKYKDRVQTERVRQVSCHKNAPFCVAFPPFSHAHAYTGI